VIVAGDPLPPNPHALRPAARLTACLEGDVLGLHRLQGASERKVILSKPPENLYAMTAAV